MWAETIALSQNGRWYRSRPRRVYDLGSETRRVAHIETILPWRLSGKESACQCRRHRSHPWVRKTPWRRKWQPTPVLKKKERKKISFCCSFSSVQFRWSVMSDSLGPHGLQHTRLPCPSLSLRVCSNSYPLSRWCHPTILSSTTPFSSCLQSFPASGSFPMSWLFASGGLSSRISASASLLPMNIQGWLPLELTGLISLLSKGLPRVKARGHQVLGYLFCGSWANLFTKKAVIH